MFRLTLTLAVIASFFFAGCYSSNISSSRTTPVTGKRIVIGNIYTTNITKPKGNISQDTLCVCIGQSMQEAFTPYLQEAGFTVITIPITPKMDVLQTMKIADSLGVDYLLTGKADVEAKSYNNVFTRNLTANIINLKSKEVTLKSSFTNGVAVRPIKAAQHLGKKIVGELKKSK
ncbi:MAG: hypothetical protein J0I41_05350 [Filimonas sp.]|nr:hypothetical protein [Filimonas sp.]